MMKTVETYKCYLMNEFFAFLEAFLEEMEAQSMENE